MATKNDPGVFDCYAAAEPDEPMFVLLARDVGAPILVESWALNRLDEIDARRRPETDRRQAEEALLCAQNMRRWRREHRP